MKQYYGDREIDLPIDSESHSYEGVMALKELTLQFSSCEFIEIPVGGAHCEFNGVGTFLKRPVIVYDLLFGIRKSALLEEDVRISGAIRHTSNFLFGGDSICGLPLYYAHNVKSPTNLTAGRAEIMK